MRLEFSQTPVNNQRIQQEQRKKLVKTYELIEDIFKNNHEDNYDILIPELSEIFLEENFELDEEIIKKGLEFTIQNHLGQYRDSGLPYAVHPVQTATTLTMWGRPQNEVISGLGHDVVEDNEGKKDQLYEQILLLFGEDVRRNIETVTTHEQDREIRDKKHKARLIKTVEATGNIAPLFIFCADKLNNLYSGKDMRSKNGFTAKERQKIYAEGIIKKVMPIAKYLDKQDLTEFKIASGMNYFARKLIN